MPYTLVNPYCTLAQLNDELKRSQADVSIDDELNEAIVNGSRWIDNYLGRDFFFHDHAVDALEFDQFSDQILEDKIFLDWPVLAITEVLIGTTALTLNTDFSVKGKAPHENRILTLLPAAWNTSVPSTWSRELQSNQTNRWNISRPDAVFAIKGTFGYSQAFFRTVTEAGDAATQLSNWDMAGLTGAVLYWQLADVAGSARIRLYSDAAFANLVAEGTGAHISTVTLTAQNSSGISGTVDVNYSIDDVDVANTLTPDVAVVDRTQVPTGIPEHINLACRLIAAALSGHNRKQVVAADGSRTDGFPDGGTKVDFIDRTIPRIVYRMLGRQKALF